MVGWHIVLQRIREMVVELREAMTGCCCSNHVTPVEEMEMGNDEEQQQEQQNMPQHLQVVR